MPEFLGHVSTAREALKIEIRCKTIQKVTGFAACIGHTPESTKATMHNQWLESKG